MLSILLRRPAAIDARASRLQVCPPSLRRPLPKWLPLWLIALKRALTQGRPRGGAQLAAARDDFIAALADCKGDAITILRARIRFAASMRELWHLRALLFDLLCTRLSESRAVERMARLNRHFPTRAPRSGFAVFDGSPR